MKVKKYNQPKEKQSLIAVEINDTWYSLRDIIKAGGTRLSKDDSRLVTDMLYFLETWPSIRIKFQKIQEKVISGSTGTSSKKQKKVKPLAGKTKPVLPFSPASYRDFLLQEQHLINSTRGYVKKFMPGLFPITQAYEKLTGSVFPRFKPKRPWYRSPVYYMGNHLNFITSGDPVSFPSYSEALDYELEMGAVIVKPLKNATEKEAWDAIGGFVVFNDFSARDVQKDEMDGGLGPAKSKHFINAISPVVATADDIIPYYQELHGEVKINGDVVATVSSFGAHYSIAEAIAYASQEEQLYPGEFFATGTWPGGCALENEHWVKPGDMLELSIERIGSLETKIT